MILGKNWTVKNEQGYCQTWYDIYIKKGKTLLHTPSYYNTIYFWSKRGFGFYYLTMDYHVISKIMYFNQLGALVWIYFHHSPKLSVFCLQVHLSAVVPTVPVALSSSSAPRSQQSPPKLSVISNPTAVVSHHTGRWKYLQPEYLTNNFVTFLTIVTSSEVGTSFFFFLYLQYQNNWFQVSKQFHPSSTFHPHKVFLCLWILL